jgi:hypothetical protein
MDKILLSTILTLSFTTSCFAAVSTQPNTTQTATKICTINGKTTQLIQEPFNKNATTSLIINNQFNRPVEIKRGGCGYPVLAIVPPDTEKKLSDPKNYFSSIHDSNFPNAKIGSILSFQNLKGLLTVNNDYAVTITQAGAPPITLCGNAKNDQKSVKMISPEITVTILPICPKKND